MRRSKLYKKQLESLGDLQLRHGVTEAIGMLKALPGVKFDQTVEVAMKLGIDPRKSDQTVRGVCPMPRGTGKSVRVAVVCEGPQAQEAQEAGADVVGYEDLVQKIKDGFQDFDTLIATPEAMKMVRPLGRQLGPRGLMPNPKTGTVTDAVGAAVREAKAGRVEYRCDRAGVVNVPIGKLSFSAEALVENANAVLTTILRARPAAAKGIYLQSWTLSSTMSPGIRLDAKSAAKA